MGRDHEFAAIIVSFTLAVFELKWKVENLLSPRTKASASTRVENFLKMAPEKPLTCGSHSPLNIIHTLALAHWQIILLN